MRYADAMARAWPGQATIDREVLIACSDERVRHGAHGMEHCRICAEACRICAQACQRMLSALEA